MKPTLFQDVDGCLLVDQPLDGYVRIDYDGKSFWYHPATPGRMAILNTLFKIIWSSHSWHGKENAVLSPVFNLPNDLTTLDFKPAPIRPEHDMDPSKLRAIEKHDEPLAIVDDRVGPLVENWAVSRMCLLVKPDSAVGITEGHFNLLRAFGEMYANGDDKGLLQEFGFMGKYAADSHKDRKQAWLKLHGRNEELFLGELEKFLTAQAQGVLGKLKLLLASGETPSVDQVFNPRQWDEPLLKLARPNLMRGAVVGAVSQLHQGKSAALTTKNSIDDFLLTLPDSVKQDIRDFVSGTMAKPYWQEINDTTKDKIEAALSHSLTNSESPRQTSDRVRQALGPNALKGRARAIARSETTGALNGGARAVIDDAVRQGIAKGAEWMAVEDSHTRPDHAAANGQKSDANGMFSIGGYPAKFPGDPDLPAALRVNCRCGILTSFS